MDIVVLAGGLSAERDVSVKSGEMAAAALRRKGHRVILLDVFLGYKEEEEDVTGIFDRAEEVTLADGGIGDSAPQAADIRAQRKDRSNCFFGPNVIAICRLSDIVFLALHGEDGENGKVQAAFDLYGIKYTGNDYLSCAIAMDKGISKQFLQGYGIPCPQGFSLKKKERDRCMKQNSVSFPCVVKPACGGSSIGVSIARNEGEFDAALDEAFAWEDEVLVEDYIEGREFSVGVLEGVALPVIEIQPLVGFYDYKNKYAPGSAVETCPADLPDDVSSQMQLYAERVVTALGLETYSRMDFRMDSDGNLYCLEANTLPGMTATSLLPQEAAAVGIDYEELCQEIVDISLKKYR